MRLCNHKICKFCSRKITKLADLVKDLERYFTEFQRLNYYLRIAYLRIDLLYPNVSSKQKFPWSGPSLRPNQGKGGPYHPR